MSPLLPISPGDPRFELLGAIEGLIEAGVDALLLREPDRPAQELARLAEALRARMPGLVIHARCPGALALARSLGTPLHLPDGAARPPDDLPFARSIHDEAALEQLHGARYGVLGPVWPPGSKPGDTRPCLGPTRFAALAARAPAPLYALGGLDPARARALASLGVPRVAAIGWCFPSADPRVVADRARAMMQALAEPQGLV